MPERSKDDLLQKLLLKVLRETSFVVDPPEVHQHHQEAEKVQLVAGAVVDPCGVAKRIVQVITQLLDIAIIIILSQLRIFYSGRIVLWSERGGRDRRNDRAHYCRCLSCQPAMVIAKRFVAEALCFHVMQWNPSHCILDDLQKMIQCGEERLCDGGGRRGRPIFRRRHGLTIIVLQRHKKDGAASLLQHASMYFLIFAYAAEARNAGISSCLVISFRRTEGILIIV